MHTFIRFLAAWCAACAAAAAGAQTPLQVGVMQVTPTLEQRGLVLHVFNMSKLPASVDRLTLNLTRGGAAADKACEVSAVPGDFAPGEARAIVVLSGVRYARCLKARGLAFDARRNPLRVEPFADTPRRPVARRAANLSVKAQSTVSAQVQEAEGRWAVSLR